jgi:general secretion pathway protein D
MRSVVRRELVSERMLNSRLRRVTHLAALFVVASLLAGCHQTNTEFQEGRKAEALQDYDTALVHYHRAAQADPTDAEYKLREVHMRSTAASWHMEQGRKAAQNGDLQLALSEFEKAVAIDPSNMAAEQQAKSTAELLTAVNNMEKPEQDDSSEDEKELLAGPPQLRPLSQEPLNLKMTNDSKVVFETMAKLAGLSVIFDPDYVSHRVTVDLPGVTLEQGLDAVSFESKAFWKPLTSSVIEVAPDNAQKRKDIEDEVVGTFYISNSLTQQDLTEIVNGLRQLLDLHRVQQVNAQNAIVIRDTPDKLDLAGKIIRDIDKAKPEVLLHVQVLSADRDRMRQLGILPGQNVSLAFNPRCSVQPTNSGCSSSSSTASSTSTSPLQITLNNLKHLASADYSLTLPGASAEAILTDSKTKIIQDPEIRVTDGEKATLKIGQRVPVATGSTQAATGVAASAAVASLVNTQFTYIDVGVNIEAQPRVHPDGEVSMKLVVEVSSVASFQTIGGIQEPVISQRKIEHEVRLKDGEVNILGGLIERTDTDTLNGIPGPADVPVLKYLFSQDSKEVEDDEVLIVLTPHILRFPSINAENLRRLAAGTDSNVRVFRQVASGEQSSGAARATSAANPIALRSSSPSATQPVEQVRDEPAKVEMASGNGAGVPAQLRFNPAQVTLKSGDTEIVGISIDRVNDLSSIPMLLKYDPAVIQITEVRDGGFLSGGTQPVAIVQRIDAQKGEVMISCTRGPHSAGVNGSGTILGLVVKGVAAGDARIQIVETKAQDSEQRTIPITSGEAAIRVQ